MTTLTVTQAAAKAGVSPSTIRTWCCISAVAATKIGRRWHINPASLDYRITLTRPQEKKMELTVETLVAIGGNRWTKGNYDRVYFNGWAKFIGLEIDRYKSGNIWAASLNGETISNSEARRILGAITAVYWDAADGQIHVKWGWENPRSMTRDELYQAIVNGIHAAVASL